MTQRYTVYDHGSAFASIHAASFPRCRLYRRRERRRPASPPPTMQDGSGTVATVTLSKLDVPVAATPDERLLIRKVKLRP
jgi:hypothetical protein